MGISGNTSNPTHIREDEISRLALDSEIFEYFCQICHYACFFAVLMLLNSKTITKVTIPCVFCWAFFFATVFCTQIFAVFVVQKTISARIDNLQRSFEKTLPK